MQTLSTLGRAVVAFAATIIDDIVVLTFFFAQENLQIWRVVLGQYLGIAGLVVICAVHIHCFRYLHSCWSTYSYLIKHNKASRMPTTIRKAFDVR